MSGKLYQVQNGQKVDVTPTVAALTDVSSKADVTLGNLTAAGNAALVHAAMPSRTYVALSIPATGDHITAPGDGYILFAATPPSTANAPTIGLVAEGGGVSSRILCRINVINFVFVPVKAGDQFGVVYSEVSNLGLSYFYCNGNKPQ